MDDEILKIFGHNVKVERIKKSLSQEQLANLSGFSIPYISNVECAKHNISLVNAFKLSTIFGKTIDSMIKEQD